MTSFYGSMPALVTPFRDGAIDKEAFCSFIDWQISEGTNGVVPVGTTGESPTLSPEEHLEMISLCVEAVKGRVPVIAGTGSNSTAEAIHFSKQAEKAGADALLVVTPYYNKPTQAGLYAHYKAISDITTVPIFIYNIPGRSIIDMSVETMAELAKLDNIVGVKDATHNLDRISMQRHTIGKNFIQLSGEDMTALAACAHGAHGCISVAANVAPRLCAELQTACRNNDFAKALSIQDKLAPLHEAIFVESSPAPVKFALETLGVMTSEVRLPLLGIQDSSKQKVLAAMRHAGLID